MRDDTTFDQIVALPDSLKRTNGGHKCDMLIGPCECGAWHTIKEVITMLEMVPKLENDVQFLSSVVDSVQKQHVQLLEKYEKLKRKRKKHVARD